MKLICNICRTLQDGNPGDDCKMGHGGYAGTCIEYDPKRTYPCKRCARYGAPKDGSCTRCEVITGQPQIIVQPQIRNLVQPQYVAMQDALVYWEASGLAAVQQNMNRTLTNQMRQLADRLNNVGNS